MAQSATTTRANPASAGKRAILHPYAAALILALDWLVFSGVVASGGAAYVGGSVAAFFLALTGVTLIQRRIGRNGTGLSLLKGMGAGAIVAAPFPVAGSLVGGFILGLAGLDSLRDILRKDPP